MVWAKANGYQSALVAAATGRAQVVRLEPSGTLRIVLDDRFEGSLWATMAPVQPQKISFPSDGRSEVHFHLRATGADVAVQIIGAPPTTIVQAMLLCAGPDTNALMSDLLDFRGMDRVQMAEHPAHRGPAAHFVRVPEGTYQVAVMLISSVGRSVYVDPRPLAVGATELREVVITLPHD